MPDRIDAPLDLIVLAELLPAADRASAEYGRVHRVDRDSLDALLSRLAPTDPLSDRNEPITTFREFRVEGMWARAAVSSRAAVSPVTPEEPPTPPPPPSTSVAASAPPPPRPALPSLEHDDPLANLFDLVDDSPPPTSSTASRFVSEFVQSLRPTSTPASATDAGARTPHDDPHRSELLRAGLADRRWRALEGAWLALRLLVRRLEFRSGVRLYVIPSAPADAAGHLRTLGPDRVAQSHSEGRAAVAVVGWELGTDELSAWAEVAEGLSLPTIAAVAAPPGEEARDTPGAEWIALTVHRFLARAPYGAASDPVKGFQFEEQTASSRQLPWSPASWLLALAVARASARDGLGTEFTGRLQGEIEDLPLPAPIPAESSDSAPVDTLLDDVRLMALARDGFSPLAGARGSDRAFFPFAPSFGRGASGERAGAPEHSFAYRLLIARARASAVAARDEIDPALAPDALAERWADRTLLRLRDASGPYLSIEKSAVVTKPAGERSAGPNLELTCRPLRGSLRGAAPFLLEIPLRRV